MKRLFGILSAAALAFTIPATASADWYEEPWFWGGTGLLTGGVLGYAIGRDSGRHQQQRAVVPYRYGYEPGYYYDDAPVHLTGASYVREKRAFPFYRKTEIYPLASTMPKVFQPQAVSVAEPGKYRLGGDATEDSPRKSDGVSIQIGDNNENVTITVGTTERTEDDTTETATLAVPNQEERLPGRMVDEEVVTTETKSDEEK